MRKKLAQFFGHMGWVEFLNHGVHHRIQTFGAGKQVRVLLLGERRLEK
jgi:hypothetical protein